MTKKILFSLMAIVLCLGLIGSGFAYFHDTEASTGNKFQVGTWALESGTGTVEIVAPNAGDSGTKSWTVTNVGTVLAYVDLDITLTETGDGQLGSYLMVHLFVQDNGDIYGTADCPQAISGIAGSYNLDLLLEPGASSDISLDWNVSDEYTPDGDNSVELTIVFDIQPAP